MSTLYIVEYARTGRDSTGNKMPIPEEPPIASQTVAIGAGSVQSNAFNVKTTMVRLHTDAICSVLFGSNPTAAATNRRLAANTTEYVALDKQVGVDPALKVAVIVNT